MKTNWVHEMRKNGNRTVELKPLEHKDQMKVYVPWGGNENSAIANYRFIEPLIWLKNHHMIPDFLIDKGSMDASKFTNEKVSDLRATAMAMADIHIYHMIAEPLVIKLINEFPGSERPTFIFSSDDNIEWIDPFSDLYPKLGTRSWDGTPLEPGAVLEFNGSVFYRDGAAGPFVNEKFSVRENIKRLQLHRAMAHEADGMCVTTPQLAEVYQAYGAKNIYVYPNSILFSRYPKIELREHAPEVRILWQGGSSHFTDLATVARGLGRVLKRFKNAKLITFGQEFTFLKNSIGIPEEQLEHRDWVDANAYTYVLSMIGHDINICPLRDIPFNVSKSAVKWYESAAIHNPAATLAANVGPYQEIEHGETGMLYDDEKGFEEKLSTLIESKMLRTHLSFNASDWVHEHRDIARTAPGLRDWWQETRDKVRKET